MVYTLHWKDGTTLAEKLSTGSADIVKEILSWTRSQCLSFPALIWLLKGLFFTLFSPPYGQIRSWALSNLDTMLVEDILQTEVSDAARHSPPSHTYPPFLTPSSTLLHHSLSPSTNLLSASLLDTRPSYRPN